MIIIKGIGIFLGLLLLVLGIWIGAQNLQAPGTVNIFILVLSGAGIVAGAIILWLAAKIQSKAS